MNPTFQNIIREREWDKPNALQSSNLDLPQIMENIEKRLSHRLPLGVPFALTRFQEKVIEDERFWRNWKSEDVSHLVVQGATSAGKTLVSELAILDTLNHGQKAVVLVPLKAMVHERMVQFRKDMPNQDIFGSSSDHLEYDERLMNEGKYDVAVTVYEKFFAMLNQNASNLMKDCALLVVDELSMLSKEQRGPKLEMLLEMVRKNYPETRIMCLATCDCQTENICNWLGITHPILSTARPVGLEEHILLMDGVGIYRKIPANHDLEDEIPVELEEKVELPQYHSDWPILTKRKTLLKEVVRKIQASMENARLLIFVGSQSGSANIAKYLREEMKDLFPQVSIDAEFEKFMKQVSACDVDEDRDDLIKDLCHGIVYHHAGMSTTLREVIEEELQKPQSFIKAIVATETLTVGVNMPFDAMIILNHKVPRGLGADAPLSRQEYRNFIGRAGRLGQNNRTGMTYLFVEERKDLIFYWNSFMIREEITSALTKANEEALAPYYLGLLSDNSSFTEDDLEELFQESLTKACKPGKSFDPGKLQEELYYAYLTDKTTGGVRGRRDRSSQRYEVLSFGKDIAPYALSCDTCILIYETFYEGHKNGGLPANITREDIESDKYLLEILYHICRHPEVAQSSVLSFPSQNNQPEIFIKAKQLVLDQLKKLLEETDAQGVRRNVLWCEGQSDARQEGNELWSLVHTRNLGGEIPKLQAAMRAILLLYWTRGMTVSEIRKQTQFQTINRKLLGGDIERLAEVVSFHLDAIHKGIKTSGVFTPESSNAFYTLQTRVKYGMPRDLVRLANKHIYGLDRAKLLSLMKDAKENHLSPVQYLYMASPNERKKHLSPTQYTQLLQALERRNSVRQFDTLLEIVAKDAGTKLTEENRDCLRAIYDWDGTEPRDLYKEMKALLKNEAFSSTTMAMDGDVHCIILTLGPRKLCVGLLEKELDRKTVALIQRFFEEYPHVPRLLLVPTKSLNENWDNKDLTDAMGAYDATALLNTGFLAMVLANTIAMDLGGGQEMFEFLTDARGIYTESETRFCSLSNYVSHPTMGNPRFRLLCGNGISPVIGEMQLALSADNDLQNYDTLSWGSNLSLCSGADCPIILFLDRAHVTRSQSLNLFLARMQAQHFQNCLLLVDSAVSEETWNSPANLEDAGCSAWQGQYSRIRKAVVSNGQEAVDAVRQFLREWKHEGYLIGISYAHYDPDRDIKSQQSEVSQLRELARKLAEAYGEHRILFDEFEPARDLFPIDGQIRSLAAYRQCKINLILWNYWTKENVNCQEEYKVILDEYQNGRAKCIFLNSRKPNDPEVPKGHFVTYLSDTETILRNIWKELEA